MSSRNDQFAADHLRAARIVPACALFVGVACAVAPASVEPKSEALIYGTDDRLERFEVAEVARQALFDSAVVLLPATLTDGSNVRLSQAMARGTADDLCPDQPFADQPVAAFCSGVLVDFDLVLTAGHCLRLLSLSNFAVAFGYAYSESNDSLPAQLELRRPIEIVSEALDPLGTQPRLDYGWIRLDAPAPAFSRPAALRVDSARTRSDEPIVFVGSAGGTPLKLDAGGAIRDRREPWFDYFVADTDSTHGSSGAGAFAEDGTLVGILSRGQDDFVASDAGCNVEARAQDDWMDGEEFGYAARALEGLCAAEPDHSLCREACGDPCSALPRVESAAVSCSAAAAGTRRSARPVIAWLLLAAALGLLVRSRNDWRTRTCTEHEPQ